MCLVVDGENMLHGELGVALGCGQPLVAEHFLNRAQVGAFLQHVGTESVSQSVRVDVGRQTFGDSDLLDDPSYAARGEPATTLIDHERRRVLLCIGKDFLPDRQDRKSTRLNSSHVKISYAVF